MYSCVLCVWLTSTQTGCPSAICQFVPASGCPPALHYKIHARHCASIVKIDYQVVLLHCLDTPTVPQQALLPVFHGFLSAPFPVISQDRLYPKASMALMTRNLLYASHRSGVCARVRMLAPRGIGTVPRSYPEKVTHDGEHLEATEHLRESMLSELRVSWT